MKEAAGEANMTVITIVLIAIVLAVGTLIVNNMMSSSSKKAACSESGGMWNDNTCQYDCSADGDGTYTCRTTGSCSNGTNGWTCSRTGA